MSEVTAAQIFTVDLNDKLNLPYEGRRSRRFQIENLSELVLDINGRTISCMVRNISETGAMIESSSNELPNCFVLSIPEQNLRVLCRKVWEQENRIGVAFLKNRP